MENMTSPFPADLELADIIDTKAFQSLMDDFYRVAPIPMSIIDLKGEVLVGVGWQDICTKFHRTHPETRKHCIESDLRLSAGIRSGEFRLYRCLNHMWDIATPILVFGRHMGNVFSGQFFFEDEPIDYDLFRAQADRYGFDEKEYLAALEAVPRLNRERLKAGMSFFIKMADVVGSVSYSNIHLARSLQERDAWTASLRKSRQDLNRAQAVAHTGSWWLDVRKSELTWSDESYRIFGLPQGTPLSYEKFLMAIHPEDRARVDLKWSAARRGETYDIEHRIVCGDTVKWVREKAELEFDKEGSMVGGFGTVQDITERKVAEANQALLTETLRILNRGGDLRPLVAETIRLIKSANGFDAVALRLRVGEDYPYFAQDGFSKEFLHEENSLCGRGGDGAIVRDSEGRAVVECTCGAVLTGRIDPGMSCFTKGGSFWTNMSSELLTLPAGADPRVNPRNRCIHAGYQSVGLFPVRSGEEIIGLLQLNGRREGLFTPEFIAFYESLAQNIGLALQRTMAEDALRKAHIQLQKHASKLEETNKELEGFASTISHDLRSPLLAINGFARMLARDYGPLLEEEGRRRLAVVESNAIKMGSLIDDLLAYSRAGRTAMKISRIDMRSLMSDCVETLKAEYPGAENEIHVADLHSARGDIRLIRQVLSNLLGNAMKFSRVRSQPRIEVGSFEREGEQIYFVKDNGIGFDLKYCDKIFGVFQRLVSEKEFDGTGVGLAIVQRLVTRHGGRVWAEAKPGEGATFFFTLEQKSPGARSENPEGILSESLQLPISKSRRVIVEEEKKEKKEGEEKKGEEALDFCTSAPSAEQARSSEEEEPCYDYREGR